MEIFEFGHLQMILNLDIDNFLKFKLFSMYFFFFVF